jgi:hypothetical protein
MKRVPAALRLMGPIAIHQQECRKRARDAFHRDIARDLRCAIRMLRRSPPFTGVAILTLALAIGANTTVFTFVENQLR